MNGLAICGWPPVRDKYLLGQGASFAHSSARLTKAP
jgi:hypothetical protein